MLRKSIIIFLLSVSPIIVNAAGSNFHMEMEVHLENETALRRGPLVNRFND